MTSWKKHLFLIEEIHLQMVGFPASHVGSLGDKNAPQTKPYESRPLPIVGLMVEKSHPQVIGLDRGNHGNLRTYKRIFRDIRLNHYLDLFKVFYFLPWDSSPLNRHLGEYL